MPSCPSLEICKPIMRLISWQKVLSVPVADLIPILPTPPIMVFLVFSRGNWNIIKKHTFLLSNFWLPLQKPSRDFWKILTRIFGMISWRNSPPTFPLLVGPFSNPSPSIIGVPRFCTETFQTLCLPGFTILMISVVDNFVFLNLASTFRCDLNLYWDYMESICSTQYCNIKAPDLQFHFTFITLLSPNLHLTVSVLLFLLWCLILIGPFNKFSLFILKPNILPNLQKTKI